MRLRAILISARLRPLHIEDRVKWNDTQTKFNAQWMFHQWRHKIIWRWKEVLDAHNLTLHSRGDLKIKTNCRNYSLKAKMHRPMIFILLLSITLSTHNNMRDDNLKYLCIVRKCYLLTLSLMGGRSAPNLYSLTHTTNTYWNFVYGR